MNDNNSKMIFEVEIILETDTNFNYNKFIEKLNTKFNNNGYFIIKDKLLKDGFEIKSINDPTYSKIVDKIMLYVSNVEKHCVELVIGELYKVQDDYTLFKLLSVAAKFISN